MKITGIVAEYNPFHYGHAYHIQESRRITQCDLLIVVMSGNFVQKGEPAIISKKHRALAAIAHGADLVLELPFAYATQSASYFAKGAIDILRLAKVDTVCFGSESNQLKHLKQLSATPFQIIDDYENATVKHYEAVYGKLKSNDILALNYLKAMPLEMDAVSIHRQNDYHDERLNGRLSSATAIRSAIKQQRPYQFATPMQIENPIFLEDFYPYIRMLLLTHSKEQCRALFMMDEGIENRFIKAAQQQDFEDFMNIMVSKRYTRSKITHSKEQCRALFMMDEGIENRFIKAAQQQDFEDFMNIMVSKRYTRSKIKRTLIHLLNQTSKKEMNELPAIEHCRVLAFNSAGQAYLKQMKKERIFISRFNQIPDLYRSMEMKSAWVYAQAFPKELQSEIINEEVNAPWFYSSL